MVQLRAVLVPILLAGWVTAGAQLPATANSASACRACIQAHEDFLASDALQGRGSGTPYEKIAATYIASALESYGIKPAAEGGGYLETAPSPRGATTSVVGELPGRDASAPVLLLTAHLDHLGVLPQRAYHGDDIYNGANDDASGCTAVLELARALAAGPPPRRSVYFAFFGSEEDGGWGARYFVAHPPVPLSQIFANIEFEMIGWPDPKVPPQTLWLTGWSRSNLGPELAKDGAHLVADPHPAQKFFCRSDNIHLAEAGVVAQTVSSYGMQPMYHRPDDDLAHIDIDLMTSAIGSMIDPVRHLLDSNFVPAWNAAGQPQPGGHCQ
ncbi:MAG TPA: M20/M25/M40 family metallo-hydrolase [Terriglobales bacterium]|jgi:Zn-dependent M28 family amino/carboxypeptidase